MIPLPSLNPANHGRRLFTNDGIIGYVKQKNISAVTTATVTNDDYTEETYDHIKKRQ